MAFMKSSGTRDILVGYDDGKPVRVILRSMPDSKFEEFQRKFGKYITRDGQKLRIIPTKNRSALNRAYALWFWKDSKNWTVELDAAEDLPLYERALSNGQLSVGAKVCLDGNWTDELKEQMLDLDISIGTKIVAAGLRLRSEEMQEEIDEDEGAAENLADGSDSSPGIQTSPSANVSNVKS